MQPALHGDDDATVTTLNSTGTALVSSTFLGGSRHDSGSGIALDVAGQNYVTGDTFSTDDPLQPLLRGNGEVFVAKIASQLVTCTTTISGARTTLVVRPGGTTCLVGAQVAGAISLRPGARLFVDHSYIGGAIVADAPGLFALCDSTARGAISVSHATGFVLVGDPTDDACGGNAIGGAVVLRDNHQAVEVAVTKIGGSLVVNGTSGTGLFPEDIRAEIEHNVIGGALVCSGNMPAPSNDGQPNTVAGAKTGQCVGL